MYIHQQAIVLDAPWSYHWPKLLHWAFTEGLIIALGDTAAPPPPPPPPTHSLVRSDNMRRY